MASFDASRYHSAGYMQREARELWPRVWLLAAHESELAQAGDYRSLDIGARSLLVVRGDDGVLRAFHNACQHRGMPLTEAGRGRMTELRCPYHRWQYAFDGTLASTPPGTCLHGSTSPIAPGAVRLSEARCASAAGFVWLCMDPTAESLDDYLGKMAQELTAHDFGRWSLTQELSAELACNWKASVDAHNEAYHVPALHPEIAPRVDTAAASFRALDRHSTLTVPFVPVRARERVEPTLQVHLFPNVQLNVHGNDLLLFRHWPHPTDPGRMRFEQLSFARRGGDAAQRPVAARKLDPATSGFGPVTDADIVVVQRQQRGLASGAIGQLALTSMEPAIAHMHQILDRYLPC